MLRFTCQHTITNDKAYVNKPGQIMQVCLSCRMGMWNSRMAEPFPDAE